MDQYRDVRPAAGHDVLRWRLHEQFKVAIWSMASILFLGLAWHMEEHMLPELVFVFWTSSELFALGGCYWLFIYRVPDSNGSGNIMKGVLWLFAAALSVVFALKKMKGFPPTLAILVYAKVGFVVVGGFCRLFLSRVAASYDVLRRILPERYKVLIWIIASILSLGLAWLVREVMPPALVFILWTSSELFALGGCYWLFIYRVPDSNVSGNIMKGVVWVLAAALSIVFAFQKTKSFSPTLAILVYVKAGLVILGGFYRLFLYRVAWHPDPILAR